MKIIKMYPLEINRETLFKAWVSPDLIVAPITKMECNPVAGGIIKLYSESPMGIGVMSGRFMEVVPNEKLVYTWSWEGSGEDTTITVEFKDEGTGSLIFLEHAGFQTESSKVLHESGWDSYITKLSELLL